MLLTDKSKICYPCFANISFLTNPDRTNKYQTNLLVKIGMQCQASNLLGKIAYQSLPTGLLGFV
ncbi:MAG: hypothetical protein EOO34_00565 [Cyanobacteriota bacterium]|nr:MAG: hypothetical protein EOO34_00565 [Cyanobacteriota bacterium]